MKPTQEQLDPRPSDMAELARQVAKELRQRAVLAEADSFVVVVQRWKGRRLADWFGEATRYYHNLCMSKFDNLTPVEIADVIQAEEAARAAEWAGDE